MILTEEEIHQYLGKEISDLEGRVNSRTIQRLQALDENARNRTGKSFLDHIVVGYHLQQRSLKDIADENEMCVETLLKIFKEYGIPSTSTH
ncbi:MAG TPA: hypothetical protein VJH37_02915 [Candidatus Nanoarchaeia archaeon]|nr:hypothetical protein [Candidatus Nanoarchaeia archaeon]